MNWTKRVILIGGLLGVLAAGTGAAIFLGWGAPFSAGEEAWGNNFVAAEWTSGEPIEPIPLTIDLNPDKVALGNRLFHDPRLSRDDSVSCASCHDLKKGGTDRLARSQGIGGAEGEVNAPTVFNSGLQFKLFWDGRSPTLEDQIDGPIHNAKEMGADWNEILKKLRPDPTYRDSFSRLYSTGIQSETIKDAIAVFERSLQTPDCRFDQFLRGNQLAITQDEKQAISSSNRWGAARAIKELWWGATCSRPSASRGTISPIGAT
jgi:cytochrome c peroxidase